ncbi:DUF1492 domain-containing protein [Eubacteriales bacterium OttesenSCG-928-N13]|nr:DUF1492 domain-containing protein [Eubacteriales bacterium OttesenSCG-928-N13]
MNTKDFFKAARYYDQRKEKLNEQIERLRSRAEGTTPSYKPKVKGGERKSRYDGIPKLLELEQQVDDMDRQFNAVLGEIRAVKDPRQQDVLWLYYIDSWSWKEICTALDLSRTLAWQTHAEALEAIDATKSQHIE